MRDEGIDIGRSAVCFGRHVHSVRQFLIIQYPIVEIPSPMFYVGEFNRVQRFHRVSSSNLDEFRILPWKFILLMIFVVCK